MFFEALFDTQCDENVAMRYRMTIQGNKVNIHGFCGLVGLFFR
jgi:hypothetical protein